MCLFVSIYYSPLAPNPNPLSLPPDQELLERVSRINGGSPAAWADSFVQHVLSPQGTFAAEREEGAYPQQQLPTPEDPL